MGVLDLFAAGARELRASSQSGGNPANPAYWLTRMFGEKTSSGINLTEDIALSTTTVFTATRNLADDVGTLPCPVYEDDDGERGQKVRSHPVYGILNRRANPDMSAAALRTTLQGHAVLRGNGYAEIERDSIDRPRALWPLDTRRMRVVRNGLGGVDIQGYPAGAKVYLYTLPDGREKPFHPDKIYHVLGFGGDGLQGYSFLRYGAESIAAAAAARAYGGSFFANDATPPMVLRTDTTVSDDTRKGLRSSFEEMHRPLENKHRMAILEGGLSIEKIGINPEEAQMVDFRKLTRDDLAEWVRMPPDKVGNFDRMTFSNAEHSDIFYVKYTLRSWFVRWDQETNYKLLPPGLIAEHLAEGFLRGDTKTRGEYYQTRFAASSMTPNQIKRLENEQPSDAPGADDLWFPMNMKPASAYDENGLTMVDKANAVGVLVRSGFDPGDAIKAFGLPEIKHSGLVPITVQVDPATLSDKNGASA